MAVKRLIALTGQTQRSATIAIAILAFVLGGIERNGLIHWSQPEILLYDEDPADPHQLSRLHRARWPLLGNGDAEGNRAYA